MWVPLIVAAALLGFAADVTEAAGLRRTSKLLAWPCGVCLGLLVVWAAVWAA